MVANAEVDQGDADAVQCVQNYGAEQRDFEKLEQGAAEGGQRGIERGWSFGQFMYGSNVQEKVYEQQHPGRALHEVRGHAAELIAILMYLHGEGAHIFCNLDGNSIARLSRAMLSVNV